MLSLVRRLPTAGLVATVLVCGNAALLVAGVDIATRTWEAGISDGRDIGHRSSGPKLAFVSPSPTDVSKEQDDATRRPMFFASRRPFEPPRPPPPAPPAAAAIPVPKVIVDGVVIGGEIRKAHLRRQNEAEGQWNELGQTVEGWRVAEIDENGIVLERDGRRAAIGLYPDNLRSAVTPAQRLILGQTQ